MTLVKPSCPHCGSNNLEHNQVGFFENLIKHTYYCLVCGKYFEWTESRRQGDDTKPG
jgi:transposase-like protein